MATARNRMNSQSLLPRDENAHAVGKIGSKGAGGGLGGKGLQQQQQQSKPTDRPRKLLGDITNVKNVQPYSASKAETPKPGPSKTATGGSENLWKDEGKLPSSAKPARLPLRNITNSGSHLKGASPLDTGNARKQKFQVPPSQPGPVNGGLKAQQSIVPEDINAKIQRWAEEGIEKVHFSADDMDALRQKIENEEMEKRVATVLAYRTDFPRLWNPPLTESKEVKPLDVLELDHIPEPQINSYADSEDDEHMELSATHCEDTFTSNVGLNDVLASDLNWDAINLSVRSIEDLPGHYK